MDHVTLLNVWASWCSNCEEEHAVLMSIAKNPMLQLIGLDYKDNTNDAILWLNKLGNPYQVVMMDTSGAAAIEHPTRSNAAPRARATSASRSVRRRRPSPRSSTWPRRISRGAAAG